MIAHRTKQMHVISTSTPDRQWKLPFGREFGSLCGRRAPGARKPPSSPLKVSRPSSELKGESLPGVPAASPTIWCICLSNPGAQKPCSAPTAAFSSEWSRHLLSPRASCHTCTPVCPELGLPLSRDSRTRAECARPAPPRVEWAMDAWGGGRREESGGQRRADCATATAGPTSFRCPKAALFLW